MTEPTPGRVLIEQLARIRELHSKRTAPGGMTDGFCNECGCLWPCATFHVAAGWGLDAFHECEHARFCTHEGVKW